MTVYELNCPTCGQPLSIHISDDGKVFVRHVETDETVALSEARKLGFEFGVTKE